LPKNAWRPNKAPIDIAWKGIVGGLVSAAIVWLSRRGNTVPGILPLFPTFALIGLLIVGAKHDNAGFRQACIAAPRRFRPVLRFWPSAVSRSIASITASPCWAGSPPGLSSRWASSWRRAGLNDDLNS
jgi:uncharacterized membrane protein (GlpM family)